MASTYDIAINSSSSIAGAKANIVATVCSSASIHIRRSLRVRGCIGTDNISSNSSIRGTITNVSNGKTTAEQADATATMGAAECQERAEAEQKSAQEAQHVAKQEECDHQQVQWEQERVSERKECDCKRVQLEQKAEQEAKKEAVQQDAAEAALEAVTLRERAEAEQEAARAAQCATKREQVKQVAR